MALVFAELESIARQEVARVLDGFPEEIQNSLANVAIFFDRRSGPEEDALGFSDELLGLFEGATINEPWAENPPRITLWLETLMDEAEDCPHRFRDEVRLTLLHEIGHFFGWDEEEVARRGLA